ncbi:MAG TPA: DUF1080 domain-containing protein [Bacteroidetes bacterium]|nr:DUF1080 domain-containing protein [Bacteroidota bacterium]
MKNFFFILVSALFINCNINKKNNDPSKEEWVQLFNGKDLSGWDIKIAGYELNDNFGETFYVEDGKMKVKYDGYDIFNNRFGHIFYKNKYSYYRLKTGYRFVGEQANGGEGWAFKNSGIMLHSQSAESMLKDQDFPISIEVQLLGGREEGERPTANLCTPGTQVYMADTLFTTHCINSTSKTYRGEEWVEVEVLVLGDSLVQHIVENKVVMEYTKPQYGGGVVHNYNEKIKKDGQPLTEGYISLQSESHPVEFRKIELLDLCGCMDKKAKNYKSYFVKMDNSKCRY